MSDYKVRLREKQRLRAQYDISEEQMARAFENAHRSPAKTGEELLINLERRLDAVVLRSGFARTIYQARQTVVHRHVSVNGQRVDRPSYKVRPGDVVSIVEKSKSKTPFQVAAAGAHAGEVTAPYLSVRIADLEAEFVRLPKRSEIPVVCDEQLVVEYYSR
jgi:small subunit ribosomal protein S4